jgi:DNA polymerase-3 subunit gamma/tau
MSYTVLARKYRPQTFADLSGQEHVTRTLGNAIASGRVAHAFLFTGVRGVGKTTTARILAKALNCETGPTITPCGACAPCREITLGVDLDVVEMDGASNNSVDDVRRLQETIPFRPARDRFKIVIVDEVHMFSVGAFNAFLKTLEEPPPHVKFIFATTESHKVPITIRSRCQRYDFRLIPHAVVSKRVREILAAEGLEADEEAIAIVSREAAGSMRDALTLLDQVVAFSAGKLVGSDVAVGLGIADRQALFEAATAMLGGDGKGVLEAVAKIAERGLDLLHFARSLVELLRDLVALRVAGPETELVAMVEEERRRAIELARATEPLELQRAFHAVSLLVDEIARSQAPRTALEMGLVRVATRPPLRSIEELLRRVEGAGGGGAPAGGAPGGTRSGGRSGPQGVSAAPIESPARGAEPAPPASAAPPPPAPTRATPIRERARADAEAAAPLPTLETPKEAGAEDAPSRAAASPPPPAEAMARWETIVGALAETRPALGAVLQHAVPVEVSGARIAIAFPRGSFYAKQVESHEARSALADIAERVLSSRPDVHIVQRDEVEQTAQTLARIEEERLRARHEATRKKALNHPVVVEALQLFDAGLRPVDVRIDGD